MPNPFGQPDCEAEVLLLKDEYENLFFDETPFNAPALAESTYLIVGRRGSGKTALAHYFSFQQHLPGALSIDVDEPAVYQEILLELSKRSVSTGEVVIPHLAKLWEYLVWCLVYRKLAEQNPGIDKACAVKNSDWTICEFINEVLDWLRRHLVPEDPVGANTKILRLLEEADFKSSQEEALALAAKRPVIVAIDTLERYDINNLPMMQAMAALIQAAKRFNLQHAARGIHLKVFIPGEVFHYLKESVVLNPTKDIQDPVYLFWRPKDLLRLISWRFCTYLQSTDELLPESNGGKIKWDDHREVLEKMWVPYFGRELLNQGGLKERTFPYVLRHTQMRPRQLILLCNGIAKRAIAGRRFPRFSEEDIREAVADGELDLANEIINSFCSVYPKIGRIIDAMMKCPMLFEGRELDKRARNTRAEWPRELYSLTNFRQLMAETGIVGRVRHADARSGYVDADFEYSSTERLPLTTQDSCAIHPMFYRRLNVDITQKVRVMPFSTSLLPEVEEE